MERVVKRFLMHSDDPKQNEFDELKQNLQMMKYEVVNDLKKTREENIKNMFVIYTGLELVSEELIKTNSINIYDNDRYAYQQFIHFKEFIFSNQIKKQEAENLNKTDNLAKKSTSTSNSSIDTTIKKVDPLPEPNKNESKAGRAQKIAKVDFNIDNKISIKIENDSSRNLPNSECSPSIDDFFKNRLAYDFHTAYEED